MAYALSFPRLLRLGYGALEQLPEVLGALGVSRPLLVSDPAMESLGHVARVLGVLKDRGLAAQVHTDTEPEPADGSILRGVSVLTASGADGVVALGGGSVIDSAKAMAVLAAGGGSRMIPCCPLMHGTGLFTAMGTLAQGGSILTLEGHSFDAEECLAAIDRWKVNGLAIVGDAFAKPLLRALEENPGRHDISSLVSMISSGVMWSMEVKQGLLKHNENLVLTDSFGASEAVGFGRSDTTKDGTVQTAKFMLGEHCKVFTEDFRELAPGAPEPGFIARGGAIPRGYYKDPEKTAKTFPTINGERYSIPGDWVQVEADGSLTLLGRGSVCINTAGEKVYPEEVEEVLKEHGDVDDALVVGVPDEKWGQMVTAVIALRAGASFDQEALRSHVRGKLAGYKTPKHIFVRDTLSRASNGKADYKLMLAYAKAQLGLPA